MTFIKNVLRTWKHQLLRLGLTALLFVVMASAVRANPYFPNLVSGRFEYLGPPTRQFNCIAWALGYTDRWVDPCESVQVSDEFYARFGYRRINVLDYRPQPGVDKVVLYAKRSFNGGWVPTHLARQFDDGTWSSKLGDGPLIRHLAPDDVSGPSYGIPVAVYVRVR